jgi:uncharacterized SAM-binding protein YcdF (DUF218 family)
VVVLHPLLLPLAGGYLDASTPPHEVDDVMVLGGGADTRPFVAAALYKAGYAKRILLPAVKQSPDSDAEAGPSETAVMRRVLLVRGVPSEAIVDLPGEVDSTEDEARSLKRYLADQPERTVAIVTNDYHTRRARWIFRTELGRPDLSVFAAPTDDFDANNWWRSEEGCALYATEYLKLGRYLVGR